MYEIMTNAIASNRPVWTKRGDANPYGIAACVINGNMFSAIRWL